MTPLCRWCQYVSQQSRNSKVCHGQAVRKASGVRAAQVMFPDTVRGVGGGRGGGHWRSRPLIGGLAINRPVDAAGRLATVHRTLVYNPQGSFSGLGCVMGGSPGSGQWARPEPTVLPRKPLKLPDCPPLLTECATGRRELGRKHQQTLLFLGCLLADWPHYM